MKKKVLIIGENPLGSTGNGGMLNGVLSQIDSKKFDVTVFSIDLVQTDSVSLMYKTLPFSMISAVDETGVWGHQKLINILTFSEVDVLLIVGIDLWRYTNIFKQINALKNRKGFKWVWLFPYDLQVIRADYINWIKHIDVPLVYSEYGYNILRPYVENIQYFRPLLRHFDIFKKLDKEKRIQKRRKTFSTLSDDGFLFGFVGVNQVRKNPQVLIKAFSIISEKYPNVYLYMHTNFNAGVYNLAQYARDCGIKQGKLLARQSGSFFATDDIKNLYNSFDCFVNCSMQEGLSWTVVEAMLCGTPVIASNTTSHPELLKDVGVLVPCNVPSYLAIMTSEGESSIDTYSCHVDTVVEAMVRVYEDKEMRQRMSRKGIEKGKEWLSEVSSMDSLLEEVCKSKIIKVQDKVDDVLFAQHSAAGDVLMTTRCFDGIKKRHPDLSLHYMTQKKFHGIIEGSPHIDKILDWDESKLKEYKIVYNPHGDRILPGNWGRNCNSILSDFYWKILRVTPNDFYVGQSTPSKEIVEVLNKNEKPICIIHTTGGDPQFRTYKFMSDVCKDLKDRYFTVQLGGANDFPGGSELDLRGKLPYSESAWVLSKAKIAVTVDSYISHLAGALGVSQVCLFGSGNHNVVRPCQTKGLLVCMSPDYVMQCKGLGPCSGAIKECPAKCTGLHDPKDILKAINKIEEKESESTYNNI